ncbi:LPXTG cell wall anchor domain-containing protein [Microbacterium sp. P07]|uniref:LPXTG cell wall anchor domain-containing protein n=1 Tax=Microbacterium sp. P07 TaxID=3366952 RepID=UPI00374571A5
MRNARLTGWGAAALAAVLVTTAAPAVAVPLDESATATPAATETAAPEQASSPEPAAPAEPTEAPAEEVAPAPLTKNAERSQRAVAAAAAVGDLTVTVFEDRYQDGVFDTSKVGRTGQSDAIRQYLGAPTLEASDGTTWTSTEVDGKWFFDDVPAGAAKLRVQYPTVPVNAMLFDATDPSKLQKLTQVGSSWDPRAEASVTIGEGANVSRTIGISGLRAVADVRYPDGTPASNVAVELGSNGEWLPATEYSFQAGSYEHLDNGYVFLLPGEFGVRVTAPAGYSVDEVTAVSSGGNIDPIPVTARDGAYWIKTTDASTYTSNPTFTVTLAELPTADLRVASFDDRYADGVFDATKLAKDGRYDEKNSRVRQLVTAQGAVFSPTPAANGDQVFEDVPVGEAKVYFTYPSSSFDAIFFDSTGVASADDIERIPNESTSAYSSAVATVMVDEDGVAMEVGFTGLRAAAEVEYEDGTPATGVSVEIGSNREWYPAVDYETGTYEAFNEASYYVRHLPDEIGVRVEAPEGYQIAEVTARQDNNPGAPEIDVTDDDGTSFWIDTADAASYSAAPTFTVTLEEIPTAAVDVTYFADVELDGVYESAADETIPGSEVYLLDAAGDWWATTSLDGTYAFTGVAPGEATVYVELPDVPDMPEMPEMPELEFPEATVALWDATAIESYRDVVEAETETISFEGTRINADGTTAPVVVDDALVGVVFADLDVVADEDEAAQVFVGSASVFQIAGFVDTTAVTGETPVDAPVDALVPGAEVEFLANDEVAVGEEAAPGAGAFIATENDGELAVFGAAEYGIRPKVPAGYQVIGVTAVGASGELEVTETSAPATADGEALFAAPREYRVAPQGVAGPVPEGAAPIATGAVIWVVEVAPIAVAPPVVPGVDAPPTDPTRPDVLPATGSDTNPWVLMFGASLLIAAGFGTRLVIRRRTA